MRNGQEAQLHRAIRARRLRCLATVAVALLLCFWLVPVAGFDDPLSTVLFARDGSLLGASIAADGQWRFPTLRTLPRRYSIALKQYEDRRFDYHPGVDPIGVLRALRANWRAGRVVSGASTITMQVVRLSRKDRPRTYGEKLIESVMALRLEWAVSKSEILAAYAAHAPFGGNVVGLEAATWRYFGRAPEDLTWAEAATLAVLPNSPALIHPGRNRQRLLAKRNRLLDALSAAGAIDRLTCSSAKREPLPPRPLSLPQLAPHLLVRARRELDMKARAGRIATTVDRELQRRATDILLRHNRVLSGNRVNNAAALILDVDRGAVLAYVGNIPKLTEAPHQNHVDIIPAPRSTGSVLKPLLYAAALQDGDILPDELIPDIPTRIDGFVPKNFSRTYDGAVPASRALARSLNVPAVRLLRRFGIDRFYAFLRSVGLSTLTRPASNYGLSLILGGAEGSLWDLTAIYAGLARTARGVRSPFFAPHYVGEGVAAATGESPLNRGAAYLTLQALLEVRRPGVDNAWRLFAASRKIAWKTGTSFGFRDAWAIGVTPHHAIGVWVGNATGEGRPGLTGHSRAAPILFELFGLLERDDWFEPPSGELVLAEICVHSGMRAGPHCPATEMRWIPKAGLRSRACTYCRVIHCDEARNWQVHGDCEPVADIRHVDRFVLPPIMELYYERRHSSYRPLPPFRSDCRADIGNLVAPALACIYPQEGSEIYVPRELDGERGRALFRAAHSEPATRVFWHLDGDYIGETTDIHHMEVAPGPGAHVLTLVDEHGEELQRRFIVLDRDAPERLARRGGAGG